MNSGAIRDDDTVSTSSGAGLVLAPIRAAEDLRDTPDPGFGVAKVGSGFVVRATQVGGVSYEWVRSDAPITVSSWSRRSARR